MSRHSLLRFERERQPDDNYDVRFALPYLEELEQDWAGLIESAQRETSQFVPDDLCEEIIRAIELLAKDPDEKPHGPIWRPFDESISPR